MLHFVYLREGNVLANLCTIFLLKSHNSRSGSYNPGQNGPKWFESYPSSKISARSGDLCPYDGLYIPSIIGSNLIMPVHIKLWPCPFSTIYVTTRLLDYLSTRTCFLKLASLLLNFIELKAKCNFFIFL